MRYRIALLIGLLALPASALGQGTNRLSSMSVQESPDATVIELKGSVPPTFTVFKLTQPTRLFVDISNANISAIEGPVTVENGVINDITPLQFTDELVQLGRLVIGLDVDALYSVKANGNALVITIDASQRKAQVASAVRAQTGAVAQARSRAAQAEQRARDAEKRAKEAEQRAQQAEVNAQSAVASAERKVSQIEAQARKAEAQARAAEAQALRAAELAKGQAEVAASRAADAEARALTLASEAKLAQEAAAKTKTEVTAQAAANAQRLIARAEAAEAMAVAARKEAQASKAAADARAAAAEAQTAAADARAKAAEDKAEQSKVRADQLSAAAKAAALRVEATESELSQARGQLRSAEQRIASAEAKMRTAETATATAQQKSRTYQEQLRLARAQVQDLNRSTEDLVKQAEARAKAAEARLKTVSAEAEGARAQAARSEARARQAEVSARRSAEAARIQAQQAEKRAQKAEVAAEELVAAAKLANQKAKQGQANLEAARQAAEAQATAEGALAQAEAARQQANAAAQAAQARMAAAEARAQEAVARAHTAESKLATSEEETERQAREAERLATRASAAESRANRLEANYRNLETELAAAQKRIEDAQMSATQARRELTKAESALNRAQTKAEKAAARAKVAEMKVTVAKTELSASAERSRAATQRATAARKAAVETERVAEQLQRTATTKAERAAAAQALAESRIAAAEARARELEAERTKLVQQVGDLAASRATAKVELQQLKSERAELDKRLAQANSQKDRARARRLAAESQLKKAQAEANKANIGRIDAEAANSKLAQRMKALEAQIATAERDNDQAERKRLMGDLAGARRQLGKTQRELTEKKRILALAEQKAATQAEALKVAETERARAQQQAQVAAVKAPDSSPAKPATSPSKSATVLPPPQMRTRITNVEFKNTDSASEIVVSYRGEALFSERTEGERTQIIEFQEAVIDPALERSLDTSEYGGAVQLVSSFQAPPPGDRVRIVVTLSQTTQAELVRSQNALRWVFANPVRRVDNFAALPPAPTWNPPATEIKYEEPQAAVFTGLSQTIETRSLGKPRPARRKRYSGRKINIDIKDGDIHNILRLLAKEGNVNIVTSDEVKGSITMHLKLVPWDQALEIILRTKGLDMVREGDIIRVAPSESIAKERESELKKQEVQEKLKPLEVKLITVNHASASDLMPRIKSVLSKRGTSEFDERTNTLILKDVDDHLDAAEDLIRRLDTQTPQVLIETRIVEVNEVNIQQLGIQWGIDSTWSAATGNPTGLRFPSSIGISGGADDQQGGTDGVSSNPNFVVNLPASAGLGSGGALGMTFGSIDSTFNLNVRLSALENRGSVKIVSSPKITTLDNKKARISQGVSIPISQVSAAGIQTVFFDAVLSLEATPHVTQDGNIYLKLNAQNNTPDFQNVGARGDPTILKKEAQTELLLKDGDTTVIGGIYTSNAGFNRSEVPFLARIPIIGVMFRNHQESDRRSELLIFVTPRIVNRAASTVKTAQ